MKSLFTKSLAMLIVALSLTSVASVATAGGCRFVPGHWAYGRWVPAHRMCWGGPGPVYHGCRFVGGHWYYGRWVPPHKQCW